MKNGVEHISWTESLKFIFNRSANTEGYKNITNEGHTFRIRTKMFEDDQNMILIVNNLGRSGSSWIGGLLSLIDDRTFYVYEPLFQVTELLKEPRRSYHYTEILSDIFACQAPKTLQDFYKIWPAVLPDFRKICKSKCETINDINNICTAAKSIVIKVSHKSVSILSYP